jgi:diketogulonate reductase-like aldo/keto reductase
VSNFEREDIENLLGACNLKPMVNQILVHIANTPNELISYSQQQELLVEAYSPIAHGELLKNERVREIADKYDVSVPQLSIRYTLEISSEDLETLKSIDPLDDYGEASAMPVFGGSLA